MKYSEKIYLIFLVFYISEVQAVGLEFTGELLDAPCIVDSASTSQAVTFLERSTKDFWHLPGRGELQKISIKLVNCEPSELAKVVKVTFSGKPEPNMGEKEDSFIALNPGPNKGRLAIGLLDTDRRTPLKLGVEHNNSLGTEIINNSMELNFWAFIQATPDAIIDKSITEGDYSSQVKFSLKYQ